MTRTFRRFASLVSTLTLAVGIASCTPKAPPPLTPGAPHFPDYPAPEVPAALRISPETRRAHDDAWARLQAGDLRGAERAFADLVRRSPSFYPGEAGLGFALLAEKQPRPALVHFQSVATANDRYMPAWVGQGEAQLALGNDAAALAAFEKVLAIDPRRDLARSRVDLLRFRQVQTLIESGRRSRDAGRLEEARASFERALAMSPSSSLIPRELASVEIAAGAVDDAERHAKRAIELDSNDAEAYALLGRVYETRGQTREASAAYAAAYKIDPRPAWKPKADEAKDKGITAALPAEFRSLADAQTVTRAQLAALVGTRLQSILDKAPQRVLNVATDIKGNWAEPWILPVTQAGIMEVFPNHTFLPGNAVKRSDLAQAISQALTVISAQKTTDLAKWRTTRPRFIDLPVGNVYYPSAAVAVASGAMVATADSRFGATRPATGAEVLQAMARLEQIAR
jgi:tetratricopeptide (TPR) repeat protein